jgi:hypothetical protein
MMKVELRPIASVIPYARNPRVNAGLPVSKVKASIKEFGFRQPIVIDTEGVIIAGHTRYLAAMELGMNENLGRKCRAIEISPAYVAVALERWHQHTGKTPTRLHAHPHPAPSDPAPGATAAR